MASLLTRRHKLRYSDVLTHSESNMETSHGLQKTWPDMFLYSFLNTEATLLYSTQRSVK